MATVYKLSLYIRNSGYTPEISIRHIEAAEARTYAYHRHGHDSVRFVGEKNLGQELNHIQVL